MARSNATAESNNTVVCLNCLKTVCHETATCPIPETSTFKKQVWARNLERVI